MNIKKTVYAVALTFAVASSPVFAGFGGVVHDPQSLANAVSILNEAKAQVQELKNMQSNLQGVRGEMQSVKSILGDFRQDPMSALTRDWVSYLSSLSPVQTDKLSLLNTLGFKDSNSDYNDITKMKSFLNKAYFPSNSVNATWEERNATRKVREKATVDAVVSGIAMAAKSKHTLNASHEKIKAISYEGVNSADILSALKANNQLLSLIASEMVMDRELMSHYVEMMSAQFAAKMGSITIDTPTGSKVNP